MNAASNVLLKEIVYDVILCHISVRRLRLWRAKMNQRVNTWAKLSNDAPGPIPSPAALSSGRQGNLSSGSRGATLRIRPNVLTPAFQLKYMLILYILRIMPCPGSSWICATCNKKCMDWRRLPRIYSVHAALPSGKI